MKKQFRLKILSGIMATAILLSGLSVGMLFASASDPLEEAICAAAKAYVNQKGNDVEPQGLLDYVNAAITPESVTMGTYTVDPTTKNLVADQFYIKHAVPGVTDDDSNSSTKLDIPGSNGAVAAFFTVVGSGASVSFSEAIPQEEEIIHITKIATAGSTTDGFVYEGGDPTKNIVDYTGDADKIVIPSTYTGTIATPASSSHYDSVKVVMIQNLVQLQPNAFMYWNGLIAINIRGGTDTGSTQDFMGQNPISYCPNLKYAALPGSISINNRASIIDGTFSYCPKLENIGPHLPCWATIQNGCFIDTAIRNIWFSNGWVTTIYGGNSATPAFSNPSFNGVRYIYWDSDTPTAARTMAENAALDYFPGLLSLDVGYALNPGFSTKTLDYTITVPNSVTSLTVNAQATEGATFDPNDVTGNSGFAVSNDNIIRIPVTVGSKTLNYTITVTRMGENFTEADNVKSALNDFTYTDKTNKAALEAKITSVLQGTNVAFEVSEFYNYKSIAGAKDGNTVVVPGHNGYVTAVVTLTKNNEPYKLSVKGTIPAYMETYSFTEAETSQASDFVLSSDGKKLISYTGDKKKVVLPEGIEAIDDFWMEGYAENIVMLILPDTLKTLPMNMGYAMQKLQVCYMGDQITEIPVGAFENCFNLRHIKVSENLQIIGSSAFRMCASLSDLYLPDSLREIQGNAFEFSLPRNFTLSKKINTVDQFAFEHPNTRADYFSNGGISSIIPASEINALEMYIWQFANDLPWDYFNRSLYKPYTTESKPRDIIDQEIANRVPRVITVLGTGQVFLKPEKTFGTDNSGAWGPNMVRAASDSITATAVSALSTSGIFAFEALNMTLSESAGRAQVKADTMPLSNETTANDVITTIKDSYLSNVVSDNIVWKEPFAITPYVKDTQEGKVTGVLEITGSTGVVYEVVLNRTFGAAVKVAEYVPTTTEQPTTPPVGGSKTPGTGENVMKTMICLLMIMLTTGIAIVIERKRKA